jgi:phosphohistidine swiveling domain-containing protein
MTQVCWGADARAGGKARGLAALRDQPGCRVPAWFVVLPPEGPGPVATGGPPIAAESTGGPSTEVGPDEWREWLATFRWPDEALAEIASAVRALDSPGGLLAVRSSAQDEDGRQHSHAGLFRSFLNVAPEAVPGRIVDIWRSAFTPAVAAYRQAKGLPPVVRPPAAIVQQLVRAEVAGVAFLGSAQSGSAAAAVFIGAASGLGTGVVDGTVPTTLYEVKGGGAVHCQTPLGESLPPLTDAQARAVAVLVRSASDHFGAAQDVEWAVAGGQVHILQSRPVTAAAPGRDAGEWALWVNSNTAGSYPGVVSPLSFSLAQYAQGEILRQSCVLLWFPGQRLDGAGPVLRSLLGRFRGRVYFNRLNWYRLRAGFGGMTGPRVEVEQRLRADGLPAEVVADLLDTQELSSHQYEQATWRRRWSLLRHALTVAFTVRRFRARVERTLAVVAGGLDVSTLPQLAERYRLLDRRLLRNWDGILVNDYLAMQYRDRLEAGLGTRVNDVLSGLGRVATAESALALEGLAALAAASPNLATLLRSADAETIRDSLPAHAAFHAAWQAYLARFGDWAAEELKLESPTARDDPLPVLRQIGHRAEALAQGAPRFHFPVRPVAGWHGPWRLWLLGQARARFRDRENLRFTRGRVYGALRRLFRAFGRKLWEAGALADPSDIFFLEVDEVLAHVDGGGDDLRRLLAARREEFERDRDAADPPSRFLTYGRRLVGSAGEGRPAGEPGDDWRRGVACSSGRASGPAHLGTHPATGPGPILVAAHADPAMVALLPTVAGVVLEVGNPFSHLAIVARELGVPMVAGVAGAVQWAGSGQWLEVDGSTGAVRHCACVRPEHVLTH